MKINLLFSEYNDLSKIYNHNYELINTIPSSDYYYHADFNMFVPIIDKKHRINNYNYSILKLDDYYHDKNNIENKACLIEFNDGLIALRIPYLKLIPLYNNK